MRSCWSEGSMRSESHLPCEPTTVLPASSTELHEIGAQEILWKGHMSVLGDAN